MWLGLSRVHEVLGAQGLAEAALGEAARRDPDNPVVWGRMALRALRWAVRALRWAVRRVCHAHGHGEAGQK